MSGLFDGLGHNSVPGDLRRVLSAPGGGERIAQLIIDSVDSGLGDVRDPYKPGIRMQPEWIRGLAQLLMEWYASQGVATPPSALRANSAALSLISPHTRKLLVPKALRERLGLPTGVDLSDFALVAGREALALVFAIAPSGAELGELVRRVNAGEWVMSAKSLSNEAAASGASRKTVGEYRKRPEYRRMVRNFAGWTLLAWGLNGKLCRIPRMSNEQIVQRVRRVPTWFVIRAVGTNATEGPPPTI